MNELTTVTTGEVRLSYVHLFKPYAAMQGQDEKYSTTVLVPKTDTATMARINAAIEAAKQKGISERWNGQCPPIVPTPVYDGDGVRPSDGMPYGPECKGNWVFTASAKADYPPEVVDSQGNPIINQSEVYSGIYAFVSVSFYPYAFGGKKGIGCGLGPIMKRRDGESLGGSAPSAAQAFGAGRPAAPQQYTQSVAPQSAPQPPVWAQPAQQYDKSSSGPAWLPQSDQYQSEYSAPLLQPTRPRQINPITGLPY